MNHSTIEIAAAASSVIAWGRAFREILSFIFQISAKAVLGVSLFREVLAANDLFKKSLRIVSGINVKQIDDVPYSCGRLSFFAYSRLTCLRFYSPAERL